MFTIAGHKRRTGSSSASSGSLLAEAGYNRQTKLVVKRADGKVRMYHNIFLCRRGICPLVPGKTEAEEISFVIMAAFGDCTLKVDLTSVCVVLDLNEHVCDECTTNSCI